MEILAFNPSSREGNPDMTTENFKEKSYWMTTREYTPGPSLQDDIDVDVAIVGGVLRKCQMEHFRDNHYKLRLVNLRNFVGDQSAVIPTDRTYCQCRESDSENGRPSLWTLLLSPDYPS